MNPSFVMLFKEILTKQLLCTVTLLGLRDMCSAEGFFSHVSGHVQSSLQHLWTRYRSLGRETKGGVAVPHSSPGPSSPS